MPGEESKNSSILIRNVYYMLAYAFQAMHLESFKEIAGEEFDNIHNLFAAILGGGIGQQLKQGLYREYLDNTEDLSTVRGKIDLSGTIRNETSHRRLISCEHDELTENCLLNRILKTTASLLIRCEDVQEKRKDDLVKEMRYFTAVDEIRDISSISWSSIRFHRNNQTYRILIGICQMILQGMLLTTDTGTYKLAKFMDDQLMCRLYEKFILEYYRKEHPEISASSAKIPWIVDDGYDELLPDMKSDVMLTRNGTNTVLIIDAKFYENNSQEHFNARTWHSGNLYQIYTYVKNKDAQYHGSPHTVSGMLLYARTTAELQPDNSYSMDGNRIDVRNMDLNRDFSEIRSQLDGYVHEFFGI